MKKTAWWLRIVAAFYLILFAINMVALVIDADHTLIRDTIPGEATPEVVSAFIDAWVPFILAIGTLGVVAAVASRRPHRAEMFMLTVIVGELMYGVVGDVTLIARGYSAASYIPFIAVHLLVSVTGTWLLRVDRPTAEAVNPRHDSLAEAT